MNFFHELERTLWLLRPTRPIRWLVLVALAVFVAVVEAVGAGLIYVLLGLVSDDPRQVSVPFLGTLVDRFGTLSLEEIQLGVAVLVVAFFLLRAAIVIGQSYVQARMVHTAGARLATTLVRGYLAMPYLDYTRINSSELVRNAFDAVYNLVTHVVRPAVDVISESILAAGFLAFLLLVAPQSALVAILLLGPMIWLLQGFVQPRLKRLGRRSQDARRDALQAMQQAIGGLREIRVLGREGAFADYFARHRKVMAHADYMKLALAGLPRTLIETGLVIVISAILLIALLTGASQQSMVATIGVFAYAGLRLQPSLRKIVQGLNDIRFGGAIIDNLTEDRIRVDAALAGWQQRRAADAEGSGLRRAIELRDVTFRYDQRGEPVIERVSLTIRRGEFIGICGPTGSGKSTLIDLITGLLRPDSGEVLIDGRVLDEHPGWWYAQLGVVSQHIFLTDDTIRRNIAFGLADDEIDDEKLLKAVERAQLTDVIERLPQGIDTVVGERGVRLSGGQRQRVAVARALYREPSVIIFDEGTSALDTATETAIASALSELKAGRTLISVAHRISTLREADRIFLVDGGRIVAEGTYEELLETSPLFGRLAGVVHL